MKLPFEKARWIWMKGEASPENLFLAARKTFSLHQIPCQAMLHISADSRYVLYINGQRIGQGPSRCWPFDQQYDSYEVASFLKPGRNVIAILIIHFGISTFQYIAGRGGLLCQLEMRTGTEGKEVWGSDATWKVTPHPAYRRPTPRISSHHSWNEQFDARLDIPDWTKPDGNDTDWPEAVEIGPVGTEPWTGMSARQIPFLTEEPVYPARTVQARIVHAPQHLFHLNLRPHSAPGDRTANPVSGGAVVATVIRAEQACEVAFYGPVPRAMSVNGKRVAMTVKPIKINLVAGENLLVMDQCTPNFHGMRTFGLDSSVKLQMRSPLKENSEEPLAILVEGAAGAFPGPAWFIVQAPDPDHKRIQASLNARSALELRQAVPALHRLGRENFTDVDVNALSEWAQPVAEVSASSCLINPQAMCAANLETTTICPHPSGDLEVIVDFGREIVGFIEFECQAPAGVILDFCGFEGYDRQGQPKLTGRAALRYVTRDGWQFFHSVLRRGFRYLLLTVRNQREPIRIRTLRCLFNTLPTPLLGHFHCSDELLNRIWEIGAYTARCCMEDTFVDCPHYEQTFWLGDARNEALISYAAFGAYDFAKRNWLLAAQSMRRSPVPESQIPSGWQLILTAYAELWVIACEETYVHDGDRAFIREIYPAVAQALRNFLSMRNGDGLLKIEASNFMDWADMDTPCNEVVTHANAWLVRALRSGARLARIADQPQQAEEFERAAENLIFVINKLLWSEEAQAYIDSIHTDGKRSKVISQQTNTVIYLCEVVPADRLALIEKYILNAPPECVPIRTPFMAFFSFEAMVKIGRFDIIVDWIRNRWGEMLKQDATTTLEYFVEKDGGTNGSHCHAWSAAPTYFLSACQLGVRPAAPGFKETIVAPVPADLTWCHGRMPTPHGEIDVAWERQEDFFRLVVKLPGGIGGEAVLPVDSRIFGQPQVQGVGAGEITCSKEGWRVTLQPGAQVVLETVRIPKSDSKTKCAL